MNERGDASVEFLGILVVVVIPVLYIVLAIGQVSAGAMAVDAGAREAARLARWGWRRCLLERPRARAGGGRP